MAKIRFETGQVVNFEGDPTPADVEEVAKKLGISKAPQTDFQKAKNPFGPSISTGEFLNQVGDVAKGVGKGALSSLKGVSNLVNKLPEQPFNVGSAMVSPGGALGKFALQKVAPAISAIEQKTGLTEGQLTTPLNTPQKIGFGIEQAAEFLAPGTA